MCHTFLKFPHLPSGQSVKSEEKALEHLYCAFSPAPTVYTWVSKADVSKDRGKLFQKIDWL